MTPCVPLQRLGTGLGRMTSPDTAGPLSDQGQQKSYTPRLELSNKSCCLFFELPILFVLYVYSISDILNLLQMLSPLFYQAPNHSRQYSQFVNDLPIRSLHSSSKANEDHTHPLKAENPQRNLF